MLLTLVPTHVGLRWLVWHCVYLCRIRAVSCCHLCIRISRIINMILQFFSDAKLFMTCNIFNYHSYIIELLLVVAAIKNSTSKIFSTKCCCSEVFPKLLSLTKYCQTSWNLPFHQNLRQLLRNCNNRISYFSDHTLTTLSGRLVQKWPNDKSLK